MRAQRYSDYGSPDVLELRRDLPMPRPGPDEVLVEVRASAVNPIDWKLRRGNLRRVLPLDLPFVPGRDLAGVVLQCGERATAFAPGDEVFGLTPLRGPGSHAQRVCVPESHLARAPKRLHHFEAAAMPLAGLTALQALERAELRPGERVLVQGGAGAVGSLVVQLARHRGAEVVATAEADDLAYLAELGAEGLDFRRHRFEDELGELDVVVDCVGGDVERRSLQVLGSGGRLVSVVGPEPESQVGVASVARAAVALPARILSQLARGRRYSFVSTRVDPDKLRELAQQIDAGQLDLRLDRSYDLDELAEAHRRSETGQARGKLVLAHG